jgi:hypothetical protein
VRHEGDRPTIFQDPDSSVGQRSHLRLLAFLIPE